MEGEFYLKRRKVRPVRDPKPLYGKLAGLKVNKPKGDGDQTGRFHSCGSHLQKQTQKVIEGDMKPKNLS